MGRRGDPRPGVRCPLLGPALPALLLTLLTTACDGTGGTSGPGPHGTPAPHASSRRASPQPTGATSASPGPTSPADLCTRLVSHWSRAVLDGTTYGDYQSMGLSHGQYAILREVVVAARVVKRRQGAAAADTLIDRQARRACADRYRYGIPSESPWQ
ncbi:hypothetical protein [Streptomyces monashensis]|uniref:Lipoprotein n=1 Tax=Streptomyces monashensis TaxID=1678012 RepID=A0A1S2QBY9_9ACTN|nr:hypothetical protein [Streptomyces monashensis]OIK03223.1 hypothetical protein BIV23_22590 [Streptomyces monashensis]